MKIYHVPDYIHKDSSSQRILLEICRALETISRQLLEIFNEIRKRNENG